MASSNLEGRAPARPQNFGTAETMPSELMPNKFGAQKIRHQPLAEASGISVLEHTQTVWQNLFPIIGKEGWSCL